MIELPAGPADPLHIVPPWSLLALSAALALVLLSLLILLWRRRTPRPEAALPPLPPIPTLDDPPPEGVEGAIEALKVQFLRTKAFRDGCHALARLVKTHLAAVTGLEVEEMTAAEIERAWLEGGRPGGPRTGLFMRQLTLRRYGRAEPRRRHFVEACEEAKELLT